uniref:Coiled-coil domain containing 57 n=1 Tax=Oncorhynchus mykiss TaxID=8022 RepID=A0A8C7TJK7_ONCMY
MQSDLDTQLACKEKEWKELQTLRVQQQDMSLRDAQEQLSLLRERFQQLKEDFCFNLAVLEERDRELERYDAMAARAQATETARSIIQSNVFYNIVCERDGQAGDLQKQRAEYDGMKRDLQRRVQEVEGQLALQKQEMMTDFDNEMRQREHEFNLRMDEMRSVVLSHELRVKLLSKETEVHSQAQAQAVEALKASEDLCQHTHTQLQHRHWEIKDITAVKDARIKDLVDKLKALQTKRKREEEVYNKKHEQLDRGVREREAQLDALKDAHREQLRQAETHSGQLQSKLEAMATHTHRTQRDHEDTLRERDQQIDRLRMELETTRSGWDTYITQISKETVFKDTELLALQEIESKLRTELDRSRGETERYKQQLFVGVEREKALEQRRIQVELEWQRRCEDNKTEHYLHSEELIQGLTQARDQASAELREKERELQDMSVLLHTVTKERDQALGLPGGGVSVGELPSDEIHRLQQQNSSLRAVIAQMRRDMEDLSHPPIHSPPTTKNTLVGTPEYTQALEEEVAELKARCRRLEDQLEGSTRPQNTATVTPATTLVPIAPDNAYLQNHIRSLNETIGGQRVEKVANTAALRKQEVRVAHLEAALASLTKQCHTKQMEGEELRLELANQKRSWSSEERGLRQRLVVVEMELEEVRREKEEYQKGSILNNLETVALGNQVSALKIDIASRRDPIVCEESEMVRQLQEENLCLRQQHAPLNAHLLQSKLKQAVQCIARLTRDKQQLIEMGNRLRAQLTDAGLEVLCVTIRGSTRVNHDSLQELQYAQREQRKGAPIMVRPCFHFIFSPLPQRPRTKENTPPISQSQSSLQLDLGSRTASSPSGPLLLSSVATEGSLREVWQILDRGLSPSILTPRESCSERGEMDRGATHGLGLALLTLVLFAEPTALARPGWHQHSHRLLEEVLTDSLDLLLRVRMCLASAAAAATGHRQ